MRISDHIDWQMTQSRLSYEFTKNAPRVNKEQSNAFCGLVRQAKHLQQTNNPTTINATKLITRPSTTTQVNASSSIQSAKPSEVSLDMHLANTLVPDAQGNVHEEQLQHGVTHYLLGQENPAAAERYLSLFDQCIGRGHPPCSAEDAVKIVLNALTQEGLVSRNKAEEINGVSFRTAQLDQNLTALFDNRGSNSDPTIAVRPSAQAGAHALDQLNAIRAGEIDAPARPLTAPSNQIASNGQKPSSGAGFLWKPISESDGKLVVLLPANLTGNIRSAGIYSALPPSSETLIESGRFAGDRKNGGRSHFRFTQPGSSYPDEAHVVAHLTNGSTLSYQIGDSSQRNT